MVLLTGTLFPSAFSKRARGLPFPQCGVWSSCVHLLHTPDRFVFLPFMFPPPQPSSHQFYKQQKQRMVTYLFLIQMYMIHILTVSPSTTTQAEPGPLGQRQDGERSWWALPSASPAFPGCSPGSRCPDTAGTGASLSEVIGRGLSAESGTLGSQPQAQVLSSLPQPAHSPSKERERRDGGSGFHLKFIEKV